MLERTVFLSGLRHALLVLLIVTGMAMPGSAQPANDQSTTRLLPVTGVLTDSANQPRRGSAVVTFGLFDSQQEGTLLWTEVQEVQADDRGRFSAFLGAVSTVPQEVFSNEQARWLSISVDGREQPRVMLVAVPYALHAADAQTLGGKPLSSFVQTGPDGRMRTSDGTVAEPLIDGSGTAGQLAKFTTATDVGSSIITETASNRIGIGTADPTEGGTLDSKVTIRGADGGTALAVSNQAGVPRFALNINSDGSWITFDRASGLFQPGIAQRGGRVGISTTDPTGAGVVDSKFTVRNLDNNTGIALLNESNARRFAINTLATGGWTAYDGVGGVWRPGLSQHNGNIGIGVTAPAQKLEVNGNVRLTTAGNALQFADGSSVTSGIGLESGSGFHYINIPGSAFHPRDSGTTYNYAGTGCVTADDVLTVPVRLPAGVQVNFIRIQFNNTVAGDAGVLTLTSYDGLGGFVDHTLATSGKYAGIRNGHGNDGHRDRGPREQHVCYGLGTRGGGQSTVRRPDRVRDSVSSRSESSFLPLNRGGHAGDRLLCEGDAPERGWALAECAGDRTSTWPESDRPSQRRQRRTLARRCGREPPPFPPPARSANLS